jgi:hypothetical protein
LASFYSVHFVPVFCLCRRFDFHKFSYLCFQISAFTQHNVSVSRTMKIDVGIKAGKTPKKKNKKKDNIENNMFMNTLSSLKKEKGMQRYVSKCCNHRSVLHLVYIFQLYF